MSDGPRGAADAEWLRTALPELGRRLDMIMPGAEWSAIAGRRQPPAAERREHSIGLLRRRRAGAAGAADPVSLATLTYGHDTGLYAWLFDAGVRASTVETWGRTGRGPEVVARVRFDRLKLGDVFAFLGRVDRVLVPDPGLKILDPEDNATLTPWDPAFDPSREGRTLLLVHDVFLNAGLMVGQLNALPPAAREDFFRWVRSRYARVLVYDHWTLSRGAAHNAVELSRVMAALKLGDVDVMAHGRGGLVCRWWLECVPSHVPRRADGCRVVFLGCPWHGTKFFASTSLARSLDVLTNVAIHLRYNNPSAGAPSPRHKTTIDGASAALLTGTLCVLRVIASPHRDAGRAPAVAVAAIPGLACQSPPDENPDYDLFRRAPSSEGYSFICADHKPAGALRLLVGPMAAHGHLGPNCIFDGPNDLSTDANSALPASDLAQPNLRHVGNEVHHWNYLQDEGTVNEVIRHWS